MDLSVRVYEVSDTFPPHERFGLASQLRRSTVSIASNISEGFGRETRPAFANFVRIARGSLAETETHIELAHRLNYITSDIHAELIGRCDAVGRMLRGLLNSLTRHQAPGTKHP